MTIEPISDERLAEIRDDAQTCLECGILFDWPPSDILALLSRLDKAEAGWQPTKAPDAIVRDGFASKIEWIRAYRAKHNAPLKEALKAYEDGTPLDGAPATFEVHQEGCA